MAEGTRKWRVCELGEGFGKRKMAHRELALGMSMKFAERDDEIKDESGRQQKRNRNCVLWMKVLN